MPVNYGGGLKGAAGGALAGSSFGPVGTVAGGLIGGAVGLFGGGESEQEKQNRERLDAYYNEVHNRAPVQLGPTQYGQTSGDMRNRQLSLADQLQALSEGKGPSLAEQQMRSATDRNVAQQTSFANSGRGGPMAAGRAANNSARLGADAAGQAMQGRIAEGNQARSLLGLNLHGMRGQDEQMSQFNATQGNEANQAQMWATLKQQGMTDDAILQILGKKQAQESNVQGRTSEGDAILAGGASMFNTYATNKANMKIAGK